MPDEGNDRSALWRLSSIGIELAASIAGLGFLGYWIDRHYDTAPKALLICIAIGTVGGLYNAVRAALKASQDSAEDRRKAKIHHHPAPPGDEGKSPETSRKNGNEDR